MSTIVGTIQGYGHGYYDAAKTTPDRDWGHPTLRHEDLLFTSSVRYVAIARTRQAVRNMPLVAAMVLGFARNVGRSRCRSVSSDKWFNKQHANKWFRWAKKPEVSGLSQRQAERIRHIEMLVSGEIFWLLQANGKYRLVPSEFCGSPTEGAEPGEVNGIIYKDGAPIGYRFGVQTSDGRIDYSADKSTIVDARYVIHDVDRDRVSQGRGIPWILPSLNIARDLHEIFGAKVKQTKSAAQLFAYIEKVGGAKAMEDQFGSAEFGAASAATVPPDGGDESGSDDEEPRRNLDLKDGTVVVLEPGEKINLLMSEYKAEDFKTLVVLMAQAMSAPIGIPVESWFVGFQDSTFAGFKATSTAWKSVRRDYLDSFVDSVLERLSFWRLAKWIKEGDLLKKDGTPYTEHPDQDYDLVNWMFDRPFTTDAEREAKTNAVRLASGEITVFDIWEEEGFWEDEVLEKRRQQWFKLQVAAGKVEADTDPESIEYPESWLLYGKLPGEKTPTVIINEQPEAVTTSRVDAAA